MHDDFRIQSPMFNNINTRYYGNTVYGYFNMSKHGISIKDKLSHVAVSSIGVHAIVAVVLVLVIAIRSSNDNAVVFHPRYSYETIFTSGNLS